MKAKITEQGKTVILKGFKCTYDEFLELQNNLFHISSLYAGSGFWHSGGSFDYSTGDAELILFNCEAIKTEINKIFERV